MAKAATKATAKRRKDSTLEQLEQLLTDARADAQLCGRSDYLRGLIDGYEHAIAAREIDLRAERTLSRAAR